MRGRRVIACAMGAASLLLIAASAWGQTSAAASTDRAAEEDHSQPVAIDGDDALSGFRQALRALGAGARRSVRIMHFGDSNVAANLWTATTRGRLQEHFGDGGHGYVVPPPWGSRPHPELRIMGGRGWDAKRHGRRFGPPDGLWGLAGVAVEGRGRQARLTMDLPLPERGGVLEVHALGRQRGGRLRVSVDGRVLDEIDTRRRQVELVRQRYVLGPGDHRIVVATSGPRAVRLLGLVAEHNRSGVIYDVLGINGHRQSAVLRWNRRLLQSQLSDRQPDLLILGYGGNEALDPDLSMRHYERDLARALSRVRGLAPTASCLVVAPVAMCGHARSTAVTAIQRRVAPQHGCAFWDTPAVSGGSLCTWRRLGLVSPDGLHLSPEGYELIGERFADALLAQSAP